MHAVYGNVLEGLTLKQCQGIHAVIDEHGKAFSKSKGQLDEKLVTIKNSKTSFVFRIF